MNTTNVKKFLKKANDEACVKQYLKNYFARTSKKILPVETQQSSHTVDHC